jgi:spore maturation protein CgeB
MEKDNLIIAMHGEANLVGGRYNVLSSFSNGLFNAFQQKGVRQYTLKECVEKKLRPDLVFGFNITGIDAWQSVMDNGIPNIMWSVDSIFAQNFEVMEKFHHNPNFILFSVTSSDSDPLKSYFPGLQHAYAPHATDLNLWKKQDVEKDIDVVLFSSIEDYEKKIDDLKNSVPEDVFKLMMEFYVEMQDNPTLPFWEIYQIFKKHRNLNFDSHQYFSVFRTLSYIMMNEKKAKTIQALKDFNVKVYGEGPWEKYISGNVEHMGPCNLKESIDIMNRAKIAIHPHAMQLSRSLHERPLNASAVETFVVSTKTGLFEQEFMNSMAYYDDSHFEDIAPTVEYFLSNEDERIQRAKKAREITVARHTWEQRAESILDMISVAKP